VQPLLDFVEVLIVGLAHSHPGVTQEQVALWLARVVLGRK